MIPESTIVSCAWGMLKYASECTGLASKAQERIGLDPTKRALERALAKTIKQFESKHSDAAADLFDASFFEHEAAPILAQFLIPDGHPNPTLLATSWADSLKLAHSERTRHVREYEAVAADFLEILGKELKAQPALRDLNDSRALDEMADAVVGIRELLGAARATPGTRIDYLRWLVDRFMYVDPRGISQTYRHVKVKLSDIYVPLSAQKRDSLREGERLLLQMDPEELSGQIPYGQSDTAYVNEPEFSALRQLPILSSGESVSVLQLATSLDHLAILGDPGGGKTSLLRFLALRNAQALLAGSKVISDELGAPRFPIFVRIGDFAEQGNWRNKSLTKYLAEYCTRNECPDSGLSDMFDTELANGGCLVLLDGLDEIVGNNDRIGVIQAVENFAQRHAGRTNRFIVTSRIVGYDGFPLSAPFEQFQLCEMNDGQISQFLHCWCPAVEMALSPDTSQEARDSASQAEIDGIMYGIKHASGVRQLAGNPLLLCTLALIHHAGSRLPQKRIELYKLAADTLTRTWRIAQGVEESALIKDEYITPLLSTLAYWIHESKDTGVATEQECLEILGAEWARIYGLPWNKDDPLPEIEAGVNDFLRAVRLHTGLLLERAPSRYGFMHPTFEEYFAGRYLVARRKLAAKRIRYHLHDPRWKEPILLALGFVGLDSPQEVTELIETAILAHGDEASDEGFEPSPYEELLGSDFLFAIRCLGDKIPIQPRVANRLTAKLADQITQGSGPARFTSYRKALLDLVRRLNGSEAAQGLGQLLVRQLNDPDATSQRRTIEALGILGTNTIDIVESIRRLSLNLNPLIRLEALRNLAHLGSHNSSVIPFVMHSLHDENQEVSTAAFAALVEILSKLTNEELITLTNHEDPDLRAQALIFLGAQLKESTELLDLVAGHLVDSNGPVVVITTGLLAMRAHMPNNEAALDIIVNRIRQLFGEAKSTTNAERDSHSELNVEVRIALLLPFGDALVNLADETKETLTEILIPELESDAGPRNFAAARLLSSMRYPSRAYEQALSRLLSSKNPTFVHTAMNCIEVFSGGLSQSSKELLFDLARSQSSKFRSRALVVISELEEMHQSDISKILSQALNDGDTAVKATAARCMAKRGQVSIEILSDMVTGLKEAKLRPNVREDVASLIGQLGLPNQLTLETLIAVIESSQDTDLVEACTAALVQLSHRFPDSKTTIERTVEKVIVKPGEGESTTDDRERLIKDKAFTCLWKIVTGD